jgi:hypothetical protein
LYKILFRLFVVKNKSVVRAFVRSHQAENERERENPHEDVLEEAAHVRQLNYLQFLLNFGIFEQTRRDNSEVILSIV